MALTRIRAQQISNIDYKQAARVVTTTNITLAGGAPSSVDGVILAANNRVLVNGQSTATQNGLYLVQTLGTGSNGTWVRTNDTNTTGEMQSGMIVTVTEGDQYKDTLWTLTTNDPIVLGSSNISFQQSTSYSFGNISANGTAILANTVGDAVSFVAGDNISITGNATAKTVTIGVIGIQSTQIVNGTSNVSIGAVNANVAISVAGTSNVAVFSTGSTVFKGNALPAANITYDLGSTTQRWRDIWLSNSTIYLGNTTITANSTNPLLVNGQGVVTASATDSISLTGNITGNYIFGNGSQLTGISTSSYSNSDVTSLLASFGSNTINSTGTITTTANISGGNLSGTKIVGTLTTAAQPNITSVGTLSGLTVVGVSNFTGNVDITGNINATGNLNYSNVTDLVVGDPLIFIGEDNPGNVYDLGMIVSWNDGTYQHGGWVRDASDGTWKLFGNVIPEPTTTVDFTNATYQAMQVGAITATAGTFSGNLILGDGTGGNISNANVITANTIVLGDGTGGNISNANVITANTIVLGDGTGGNISNANVITANSVLAGTITATGLTGYVKGNGTEAMTASATIPNTNIAGLGTMSTQNANAVAITGGTANNLTIGGVNPAAGVFTTLRFNSTLSANGSTGTLGQVLTSNGASPPSWTTPTGGGGASGFEQIFLLMGA